MSFVVRAALVFCTLAILATPIYAQDNAIEAEHRTELVNDVSNLLTQHYVFAEVGEEMVTLINQKLKRGDYDQFSKVADKPGLTSRTW